MKIPVFSQSGWIFIAQPSYYCLKTTKGAEIWELLIFKDCVSPGMANKISSFNSLYHQILGQFYILPII